MGMKQFKFYSGEINAFTGLFLNNVTNFLILTSLLLTINFPRTIIFKHILPGVAVGVLASGILYYYMANQLAKKENREDVTALPSGISVPHMFLVVFIVILPIYQKTGDAILAWYSAIIWTVFEGVIEIIGSSIGPYLRKKIPRAALLGSLAGVSLLFISMRPFIISTEVAYISFISFAFIFVGWVNKQNYFKQIPIGLVIIIAGIVTGILTKQVDLMAVSNSFEISFNPPVVVGGELSNVWSTAWPYLVSAIPMGVYNFIETMDNLESASVAGDHYPTRQAMVFDGLTTIIGGVFGSGFPIAVYIGHPGWKHIGGRRSYSLWSAIIVFILVFLGLMDTLVQIIPSVAILPILVFIGINITEQAFVEVDRKYIPAVIFSLLPWIASWGKNLIDSTLISVGISDVSKKIQEALLVNDISYGGYLSLAQGTILISIIWSTLIVFIIDNQFVKAAITCTIGAVLTFVGFIHAPKIGFNADFSTFSGYLLFAFMMLLTEYLKRRSEQQSS